MESEKEETRLSVTCNFGCREVGGPCAGVCGIHHGEFRIGILDFLELLLGFFPVDFC